MTYDCHSTANEVDTLLASDPVIWWTYERVIEG